ncbi:MAG: adenylosuccinate lyase [Candidatus Lokiarchaeota archaeon]|nr:adenylosuccinate lyase [Candidatus Lokiarchaeota archaeon]
MPVHPIEFRYFNKEMRDIFTEENKLLMWLKVEAALAQAHAELGNIPKDAAKEINRKADLKYVKLERVKEIDHQIHHDLMAMVKAFAEQCDGSAGKYIHLSATSYDIEDTATALMLSQALLIIKKRLKALLSNLITLTEANKDLVCVGRTHGQQALPTTYGMRIGVWLYEVSRHLERLNEIFPRIRTGKMSGAVGTMASFGDKGIKIQKRVMEILELDEVLIANQIVQRDRHAEVILFTCLVAGTIDKIAREMRILQRSEIAEMFEPFKKKQVGSSTMPHKRNPHKAERLCALSRVLKSNASIALENMTLEDERDLTNSASERVLFPENFILLDFMLTQLNSILPHVEFNKTNINKNLDLTKGAFLAEKIMIELVAKDIGRQEAHEILRTSAIEARNTDRSMKEILLENQLISNQFNEEEINEMLDPANYLGKAIEQIDNLLSVIKSKKF